MTRVMAVIDEFTVRRSGGPVPEPVPHGPADRELDLAFGVAPGAGRDEDDEGHDHLDERTSATPSSGDASLLARVRASLEPLQRARSLAELVDQVPVAVASLGFDRVLLSRVDESFWVPERMYVKGDVRWAEEILEAGRQEYRRLDGSLLETQLVRRGLPLLVTDPGNRPLMHQELISTTRTTGYAAAPITDGNGVIGFLHADCYHQRRVPTPTEMEALGLFGQSLGVLLDRRLLLDRMAEARRTLGAGPSQGWTPGRVDPPASTGRPDPAPFPATPTGRGAHALQDRVTRREAEVLALMCVGASNEQIGRRLTISVGTVKSHVKRILRKLGAANRAEAVSSWLRSEYGHLSVGPPGS